MSRGRKALIYFAAFVISVGIVEVCYNILQSEPSGFDIESTIVDGQGGVHSKATTHFIPHQSWVGRTKERTAVYLTAIIMAVTVYAFLEARYQTERLENMNAQLNAAVTQAGKQAQGLDDIKTSLSDAVAAAGSQTEDLKRIKDSLTTRYLGRFPDFVPDIVALLKQKISKSIVIVCDYPAYCYFSEPEQWKEYKSVIMSEASRDTISVDLTCVGAVTRRELLLQQFGVEPTDSADASKWSKTPMVLKELVAFLRHAAKDISTEKKKELKAKHGIELPTSHADDSGIEQIKRYAEALSFRDFDLLVQAIDEITRHDFRAASPKEIEQRLTIYFWIVDGNKAVFSIPSFSADEREQGFFTSDAKLIDALNEIKKGIDNEIKRKEGHHASTSKEAALVP
jgi:hypothetical protein